MRTTKKILFLGVFGVLVGIFLINLVSACNYNSSWELDCNHYWCDSEYNWNCDWNLNCDLCDLDFWCSNCCESEPECCDDNDCGIDYYSDNYCLDGDVYHDFIDYSCVDYECNSETIPELVNECGEDEYGEWNYFCEGDDLYKSRYFAQHGCSDGNCFIGTVIQEEFVKTCSYMCVDGKCINEPPECSQDSDCGTDYCVSPNYCMDGDVYQNFMVFTCNNSGESDAYCSDEIIGLLIQDCDCGCEAGECLECPVEPVCGNGIIEEDEECDDGNTENGDGCSAICEIEEEPPKCCSDDDCSDDYYSDNYCKNGDVYRDFHDFFCDLGICNENIISELFENCGENSCNDWDYYCKNDDVYRDRTCYNRGCDSGSCFENEILEEELYEECDEDCEDGKCIDEGDRKRRNKCCYTEKCEDYYYTYHTCEYDYNRYSDYMIKNLDNTPVFLNETRDFIQEEVINLSTSNLSKSSNKPDYFWIWILLIALAVLLFLILITSLLRR